MALIEKYGIDRKHLFGEGLIDKENNEIMISVHIRADVTGDRAFRDALSQLAMWFCVNDAALGTESIALALRQEAEWYE